MVFKLNMYKSKILYQYMNHESETKLTNKHIYVYFVDIESKAKKSQRSVYFC